MAMRTRLGRSRCRARCPNARYAGDAGKIGARPRDTPDAEAAPLSAGYGPAEEVHLIIVQSVAMGMRGVGMPLWETRGY
jgi:hypothetical protein